MEPEERLQKAIRKVNSAIVHVSALAENDMNADPIVGDLKRVMDKLHALNYETHHEGKKIVQTELF